MASSEEESRILRNFERFLLENGKAEMTENGIKILLTEKEVIMLSHAQDLPTCVETLEKLIPVSGKFADKATIWWEALNPQAPFEVRQQDSFKFSEFVLINRHIFYSD